MWRFLFCHSSHVKASISDSADACARNASPSNYVSRKYALQCTHTCTWRFLFCRSSHIKAGFSDDADACAHNASLPAYVFHEMCATTKCVQQRINTCMWSVCLAEKKILQRHNTFSHVHTHTVSIWSETKNPAAPRHSRTQIARHTQTLSHTPTLSYTHTLLKGGQ